MFKVMFAIIAISLSINVNAQSIVVLGDSISAAYGIEVQQGWVALLQQKLQQQGYNYSIHNESISGDTSAGGLARIDKALSQHQPNIVLLELGANDGLRGLSPKAMQANLTEIIQRSKKSGAKVLLLAMRLPPNYGKRYIDLFYNVYPQLAKDEQITLVPFILEEVALKKELMQADGLHPNAKGQPIILNRIWEYLHTLIVDKAILQQQK